MVKPGALCRVVGPLLEMGHHQPRAYAAATLGRDVRSRKWYKSINRERKTDRLRGRQKNEDRYRIGQQIET